MKKGIIIYQSKYGATKKYAEWLCKMTGFECVETPKAFKSMTVTCKFFASINVSRK